VAEYEQKKQSFKIAQNIQGSLGAGIDSEYSMLSYFW
jgi:hypothetical protein